MRTPLTAQVLRRKISLRYVEHEFEIGRDKHLLEILENAICKGLQIASFIKYSTRVGDSAGFPAG